MKELPEELREEVDNFLRIYPGVSRSFLTQFAEMCYVWGRTDGIAKATKVIGAT